MDVKHLFGKNLRSCRKLRGLSQEQLAEKVNVSAKHIGALESGSSFVSAALLEQFSAVLHVPLTAFFSPVDDEAVKDQVPKETSSSNQAWMYPFSLQNLDNLLPYEKELLLHAHDGKSESQKALIRNSMNHLLAQVNSLRHQLENFFKK